MLGLTLAIKFFANSSPVLGSRLISLRTLFLLSLAHCLHFSEWVYFLLMTVWQIIAPNCLFKDALKNKPLSCRRKLLQLHTVTVKIQTRTQISEWLIALLSRIWMNLQGVTHSQIFSLPDGPNTQRHELQEKKEKEDTDHVYVCVRAAALGQT